MLEILLFRVAFQSKLSQVVQLDQLRDDQEAASNLQVDELREAVTLACFRHLKRGCVQDDLLDLILERHVEIFPTHDLDLRVLQMERLAFGEAEAEHPRVIDVDLSQFELFEDQVRS